MNQKSCGIDFSYFSSIRVKKYGMEKKQISPKISLREKSSFLLIFIYNFFN